MKSDDDRAHEHADIHAMDFRIPQRKTFKEKVEPMFAAARNVAQEQNLYSGRFRQLASLIDGARNPHGALDQELFFDILEIVGKRKAAQQDQEEGELT